MNPTDRAALLADVIVLVRYPDYTRRAVIRQSRYRPETRKRTKSGRAYAQVWHIVRWLDEYDETQAPPAQNVADEV